MSWVYGLVEIDKELTICEIYKLKTKVDMFVPIMWKDIKSRKVVNMVLKDLKDQTDFKIKFYAKKDKKGNYKLITKGDNKKWKVLGNK